MLPTNRDKAWREVAPLRNQARQAPSVEFALSIFERRFHVSLDDLAVMFANENWRHAQMYGGNAWARISTVALDLKSALLADNSKAVNGLATQL